MITRSQDSYIPLKESFGCLFKCSLAGMGLINENSLEEAVVRRHFDPTRTIWSEVRSVCET